ncbi:DUF1592 domain-containing protein [Humisphaera borealis]|uniref:DUF1592 domain-containing protein n=1 Tax=Humisphaera borealis TaxID=2807512 RepID=A0A7M2X205_9BACT|nr:DUF1592 domain-containing protein [Humisphaera borealis]QOV91715.1 DUF1592 domain-containing protein [Humisphaera borealis]
MQRFQLISARGLFFANPRRLTVSAVAAAVVVAAFVPQWFKGGRTTDTALAQAAPKAAPTAPLSTASLQARFKTDIQPFLAKHCTDCHANGKAKGDFSLDPYKTLLTIQAAKEKWNHVGDVLRQKLMPPEEKPQPSQAEFDRVIQWISDATTFCDCSGPPDPGRVAIHRLNRNEYNNTVRDLLGVDFKPAADFPADDTGYGFDNIADVLTMSPLLAEKYLAAAEAIMESVIPTDNPYRSRVARYGETSFKPTGDSNAGSLFGRGDTSITHNFIVAGSYEVRLTGWHRKIDGENPKVQVKIAGQDMGVVELPGSRDKTVTTKLKITAPRGDQKITFTLINPKSIDIKEKNRKAVRSAVIENIEVEGPIGVAAPPPSSGYRRIFVAKPGQGGVTEEAAAKMVLQRFLGRAYRRPAANDEVESLLKLYKSARADKETFENSIRLCLTAVLVSPHFLFRVEVDPAQALAGDPNNPKPYAISDYELATRLSYFLWSSAPDDELMAAAGSGKLRDPAQLEAQVRRLLTDARAMSMVENFAGQWLELRNLEDYSPDPAFYPTFDSDLRAAMKRETELFFETIMKEDRSILELLTGEYTYVNERLAKHYGMSGIAGDQFRRVSLAGSKRAGFLTQASILTVTAMPTRTSPVKRGKYILENVLGTPPPPAPADVPPLSDKPKDVSSATLKIRLEEHRKDPNCAVCHIRMDGIGFTLENFDAIGRWRDKDGIFPIDSSGKMPEGTVLAGPDGLRRMLLARQSDFTSTMIRKMLTYSLGRGLEHNDQCAVKAIDAEVRAKGYKFSSLVLAIVKSAPFQQRRLLRPEEVRIRTEKSLDLQEKK